MEIYSKERFDSYIEFEKEFIKELREAFVGTKANYRDQVAYFTDFEFGCSNLGKGLSATFDVNGEEKRIIITLGLSSGVIKLENDVQKAFDEFMKILDKSEEVYAAQLEEERKINAEKTRLARIQYEQEKAKREEIKKAIEADKRYAKKVEKALYKLALLRPEKTEKLFETPMSQYEIIGWMAKHITSIRAAMPDYAEKWFVGKFGDVERYVVNSKKKTSGGFAYQWGLGLKLTFDEEVKGPLEQRATSKNKKVIDNVSFVWDLVENYGFQFGKEQNIGQIKAEVPEKYLPDFERGYAM